MLFSCSLQVSARKPGVIHYHSGYLSGLCTGSIDLYTDSSYAYETGCEETSHISYGKWWLKKDTVYFKPLDNKTYKLIDTVIASRVADDSICVTILDKNFDSITNKVKMDLADFLNSNDDKFDRNPVSQTERMHPLTDSIILYSLERIFEQSFRFPVYDNNNFIIKLSIPGEWIMHHDSDWGGNGPFQLLKDKNNFLVTFTPQFPVQWIYTKRR